MKISTKGRYALRLLIDLAQRYLYKTGDIGKIFGTNRTHSYQEPNGSIQSWLSRWIQTF